MSSLTSWRATFTEGASPERWLLPLPELLGVAGRAGPKAAGELGGELGGKTDKPELAAPPLSVAAGAGSARSAGVALDVARGAR